MKKNYLLVLLVLMLTVILAATIVACNDGKGGSKPSDPSQVEPTPPAHEHTYTLVEAKDPTCTEAGNILYYTCTCGKYFDSQKKEIELSDTVVSSTGHDKVNDKWESDATSHWHKCSKCDEKLDFDEHGKSLDWIEDRKATCKTQAHHHKECGVCGYHIAEEDYGDMGPHSWNTQNKCEICGTAKPAYDERDGKIYFGSYPQTKVEDNGLIATLSEMSGSRPVKGNRGKWTDFGYYLNNEVDEYMWYIDVDFDQAKYRGIYFTSNRPAYNKSDSSWNYQKDNGYEVEQLYWFKWEAIEWRILKKSNGEAYLMSNFILDSQPYYDSRYDRTINGETVTANNYKESDIRKWLNDTFFEWAFDEYEQSFVKNTIVDNSADTTGIIDNEYACESTEDRVFLLCYEDVVNVEYGFNATAKTMDKARALKNTDYARAQSICNNDRLPGSIGNSDWWLRSPNDSRSNARKVQFTGMIGGNSVEVNFIGVVPAINLQLQ